MITGVQDIYYNVADMDRAVAFYRDALGLAVAETSAHWSALTAGGIRIGLHWTGGAPVPRDGHGAHAGGTLTLRSDDLEADAAKLVAAGATALGPILRNPWGDLFVFADPDGNVVKLMG